MAAVDIGRSCQYPFRIKPRLIVHEQRQHDIPATQSSPGAPSRSDCRDVELPEPHLSKHVQPSTSQVQCPRWIAQ